MHSRAESSPLSNATPPLLSSQLPPPNTGTSSSLASRPSSPSDSPNQSIRSQEVSVSAVRAPLAGAFSRIRDSLGRGASSREAPTETNPTPRSRSEKKEKNVPVEQSEGYVRTRDRVAKVAVNILGTAGEVAHELLGMGGDFLGFVPVGGLQEAILVLDHIWNAIKLVQVNKTVCLRLAERCDTVLSCIREDISTAGGDVDVELEHPFRRLVTVFNEVREFIVKNSSSCFFKQYLRRDEIQRALVNCNSSLADALAMFSTSIQTRILQKILAAECQRRADTAALLDSINRNAQGSQPAPPPPTHDPLDVVYDDPQLVLAYLQTAIARENDGDAVHAADDLRQLMRLALQANSDAEMIRILQVGPDEIPEAIKMLQRSLEREVERDRAEQEAVPFSPLNVGAADVSQMGMAVPNVLTRCETTNSTNSYMSSSFASSAGGSRTPRDTLVREFFENGIDVLRRASNQLVPLPSWTITRYEVEPGEKTGEGSVRIGTWDSHVVAIKELTSTAPKELFEQQVSIWLSLQHSNVCEFIGASWVSRRPPWLITRYYKRGSLVTYLKWLPSLDSVDLLKMIQEIAKGMAYLHGKGVLHGNLKATNVLVNDDNHCVISDFGQCGMKSETCPSHTDLRWQAPELMSPANSEPAASKPTLTQETDVYAFAITVVELLAKGALPWPLADDRAVQYFVVQKNMRPEPPQIRIWSQQLKTEILYQCWHHSPTVRPSFAKVEHDVQELWAHYGPDLKESPAPLVWEIEDMAVAIPPEVKSVSSTKTFRTAPGSPLHGHLDDSYARPLSPIPPDEHAMNRRHERRYRMLLQHEFHPTLMLPLWDPSPIAIGAVGYHSKHDGKGRYGSFKTLFNSFSPRKSSNGRTGDMPSIQHYGQISTREQRQEPEPEQQDRNVGAQLSRMNVTQSRLVSTGDREGEARYSYRYSSPLRRGHKTAHLITESTNYRYLEDLSTPKRWFQDNADRILGIYGEEHCISKEDLYLVIGTLEAQDYAHFVSHEHPDGQIDFNVVELAARTRQGSWGEFSFSSDLSTAFPGGPKYAEPVGEMQSKWKVSPYEKPDDRKWDSVLLARLRFKPDSVEPTSL